MLEATVTGHASPRKGALEDPDEGRWEGEENKDGKRKGARAGRGTQARHGMESHAPPALQDDALFVR